MDAGRLMLTVLGGLAEFERELIRARTGEGRARAKARGVKLGRKPKLTPHQQREARQRRENGEVVREIERGLRASSAENARAQKHLNDANTVQSRHEAIKGILNRLGVLRPERNLPQKVARELQKLPEWRSNMPSDSLIRSDLKTILQH